MTGTMDSGISIRQIIEDERTAPLFRELGVLYAEMDRQYARAAAHYGFACTGCTDNCCMTRFHHHTLLEYAYLRQGFERLDRSERTDACGRAEKYAEALARWERQGRSEAFRMMCPVNKEGWCLLYAWRPMICRLHGIPHELNPPGRPRMLFGQGCAAFSAQCGHLPYHRFDRTPFYARMSALEKRLKSMLGISAKLKKTVAHMIVEDEVART